VTPESRHQSNSLPHSPPLQPPRQLEFVPAHQVVEPDQQEEDPAPAEDPVPDVVPAPAVAPAIAMVPLAEVNPILVPSGPRRSSRLADQTQGLYVNVVEKALKKKKREESTISDTSKTSKTCKASAKDDQDASSSNMPPPLTVHQLIRLGRECGFDEKEEGELMEAAGHIMHDE
jgi:hypothetical protein